MNNKSIEQVLADQSAFQVNFEMVGVVGLSSACQRNVFNMIVESKPFKINENNYKIRSLIKGSFSQFHPDLDYQNKFNLTDEQLDADNKAVVDNIFKQDTAHFAFIPDYLNVFFSGYDLHFICIDDYKSGVFYPEIKDESFAKAQLGLYMQKLQSTFSDGTLPEMKEFQARFI